MARDSRAPHHAVWSHFRFSVVGPLLSAPPPSGELGSAIIELSEKTWQHPVTNRPVRFARSTIERWYYQARRARQDPVGGLRRRVRNDAGRQSVIGELLAEKLIRQYRKYKHWSVKLHYDNLRVVVDGDARLGPKPSYSSVRRFMRSHGLDRRPRRRDRNRAGHARADDRLEHREVRSYEVEHVNGLWHLDFHASSLKVLTPDGQWVHPKLLGVLDDHSRLICHGQWYWSETAEHLAHGLIQAICKRGLPRALMTDNGGAMTAEEVCQGLSRLGIVHETTLSYSPYQNGKQENFWANVEGRLMAMLEGVDELTLGFLNQATQAWLEMEYNRTTHSETAEKPLDRFMNGPDVARPAPSLDALRHAFRQEVTRSQRRSDGTVSVDGVRFELPGRFRHLRRAAIHYARWNLGCVHLVDVRSGALLAPIFPLDKARNADRQRRLLGATGTPQQSSPQATVDPPGQGTSGESGDAEMAPLLKKLIVEYAATGLPPAFLPKSISGTVQEASE